MICLRLCRKAIVNPIHSGYGDDTNEIVIGVNDSADRRIKPFYFFRVSLGDQGQFYFQNSILQRLASLFNSVGASQSAAYDRKACSTSGAFLFGEWYATRSTDTSFSNRMHMNYRKNPGNIIRNWASAVRSSVRFQAPQLDWRLRVS